MSFYWPYYELSQNRLCERRRAKGRADCLVPVDFGRAYPEIPMFATRGDAEAWLEANDIRGTVK